MDCAYHAGVRNAAFCIRCGRALCSDCIRNVRGSVYCEGCLAELVEGKAAIPAPPLKSDPVAGTNPGAAFALGLIPGVGAIYNGEFLKAAVHLLIFGTLITIADAISGAGEPLVRLMAVGFYCYMPFEAYYTAKKRKLRAEGIELETPVDRLQQQFGSGKDRELWGGIALVVIGGLFLLDNLGVFGLERIVRFWPLLLVGLGVWRLKKHQERAV